MDEQNQTLVQKKIALAQSEHAPVVLEIIRDCIPKIPIVGDTEFKTLFNAITIDATSTLLNDVAKYLDDIRTGALHDKYR